MKNQLDSNPLRDITPCQLFGPLHHSEQNIISVDLVEVAARQLRTIIIYSNLHAPGISQAVHNKNPSQSSSSSAAAE